MTDHIYCKEAEFMFTQRVTFILDKQILTAEWISWWNKCFSLSSLKECECFPELVRPAWGCEYVAWANTEYKN